MISALVRYGVMSSRATLHAHSSACQTGGIGIIRTRKILPLAFAVAMTIVGSSFATAQTYPSRPITIIVPFPAGGPTDVLPRIIGERMGASLGQSIVVENIAGAGGSIGIGRVARAAPDGYTIASGGLGTNVINGAVYNLDYDLLRDFEPIALLPATPLLIGARNDLPAKDLNELISWLKANQEKALVATPGIGTVSQFAAILLQNLTGSRFQLVNYRGGPPALQDLLGGHIDLLLNQPALFLPLVREGKMKVYAVMAKSRLTQAPDIPTVDEAGLPGLYVSIWNGFWAPKGTPKSVIAKLNAAIVDAMADPMVRRRLADLAFEIPPPDQQTPKALSTYQHAEIGKWWPIIKAANIKVE
jgi:tripartite-type tricarboxylate transporter receptor subunit TctC